MGLHINFLNVNCSAEMVTHFSTFGEATQLPNLDILGVPIGDFAQLIAEECMLAKALLKALVDV